MNEQIQEQLRQINERIMDSLIAQANDNKARRKRMRKKQEAADAAAQPELVDAEVESPVLTQWNAILDQIMKRR